MHDMPAWLMRTLTAVTDMLAKMRRRLIPPALAALDMGTMSWVAQALSAFCELGLPQALSGTPRTAAELAAGGYGDEAMLFRLLRALCAYDVVKYAGAGRFTLGHVGKGLTGEHSAAPMIRYANAPWHVKAYAQLARGIRTGRPGFDLSENMSMFEYFSQNDDAGEIFDHAMQALTPMFAAPMAQAYDFSPFTSVVDVGGGTGALLAAILARFPSVRGIVFERSSVAQRARERANTLALSERLRAVEGDMFLDAPPVADAYIVSHILHDWNDDACVRILRNIRARDARRCAPFGLRDCRAAAQQPLVARSHPRPRNAHDAHRARTNPRGIRNIVRTKRPAPFTRHTHRRRRIHHRSPPLKLSW